MPQRQRPTKSKKTAPRPTGALRRAEPHRVGRPMGWSPWRWLLGLLLVAVAMLGVAYAAVPLYRMFCQLVGIPVPGVAVQSTLTGPLEVSDRTVTVRFMAATDPAMPVQLSRTTPALTIPIGEPTLTAYRATNPTPQAITGIAIHTVTMHGDVVSLDGLSHIHLLECFCFSDFTYPAGETVNLPVSFTVLPSLPDGVHELVFYYTLMRSETAPTGTPRDKHL